MFFFFKAEEVNIKGRMYHKTCLSCKNCRRPIGIANLAVGPDDDIYCNICCHKLSWPREYAGSSDTAAITGEDGEPSNCPRCGGKVDKHFLHTGCLAKKNTLLRTSREAGQHAIALPSMAN